jgi:hypothetical protein
MSEVMNGIEEGKNTDEEKKMSGDEYIANMNMLEIAVSAISNIELEQMMKVVKTSEAIAPFFHPTEYMKGGSDNLQDAKELLGYAIALKKTYNEIKERKGL